MKNFGSYLTSLSFPNFQKMMRHWSISLFLCSKKTWLNYILKNSQLSLLNAKMTFTNHNYVSLWPENDMQQMARHWLGFKHFFVTPDTINTFFLRWVSRSSQKTWAVVYPNKTIIKYLRYLWKLNNNTTSTNYKFNF